MIMCISCLGTGYDAEDTLLEGGPLDAHDHPLNSLQDLLNGYEHDDRYHRTGQAPYVSAAMDRDCFLQGRTIHILELEREFGRSIPVKICDNGQAFIGKGTSRIDLCCRIGKNPETNRPWMEDSIVNGNLTLVLDGKY
jgi:hypothetical protein